MRRVGDRFVVREELGSGGMGSVFRGEDERLGEDVAIKFLRRGLADDPVVRERFRREATSLAKLRHPGIVSVLDFGEAEGELYIVLELVLGHTLEEHLSAGPLGPVAGAPIFDQLLAALELCHDAGVVHRDIKPSNVMIGATGRVTLLDFGLARVEAPEGAKLTETGAVHGTPNYMAPEQCRGQEVGPPADVYACGVVLYEAFSGAPPFVGGNAAVLMAQHMFSAPARLPGLARGLEAAILHALEKKPDDRPTARELRHELTAAFKGTDAASLADRAAEKRVHMAGLPRGERALTGRPPPAETAPAAGAPAGTVALWMAAGDRSAELRGALGTAGLAVEVAAAGEAPPDGDVVVVSARDGLERLATLDGRAFVVVDVSGPEETTRAIRAGARDMLLAGAPDADLVPKLAKALRRAKRRG